MLFPVCALMKMKLQVPGIKANFLPGFGPSVRLSVAPSIQRLVPRIMLDGWEERKTAGNL